MKLTQIRVPERLRRKIVSMIALATASVPAACATAAEADEDMDEGSAAASTTEKDAAASCDDTINKVDDIRNRFLDKRHAAVWAFQTDAMSAFEKLDATLLDEVAKGFRDQQASRLTTLAEVTFELWTPSSKVRVRDARLDERYLVARGMEKSGGSKVILLFTANGQELIASARATKASIWSWACPSPPKQQTSVSPCDERARWNNWPNWSNWSNWNNTFSPCR